MKKLFALLLIAGCGVAFVGCTKSEDPAAKPAEKPAEKVEPAPMGDAPAADPAKPAEGTTPAPVEPAPAAPAGDAGAPAATPEPAKP